MTQWPLMENLRYSYSTFFLMYSYSEVQKIKVFGFGEISIQFLCLEIIGFTDSFNFENMYSYLAVQKF